MWVNIIDEQGYLQSQARLSVLPEDTPRELVIEQVLPAATLQQGETWRWTGDAWSAAPRPVPPAPLMPSVQAAGPVTPAVDGGQVDLLWRAMDRGEIPMATDFFQAVSRSRASRARPEVIFDVGRMPEA